MSQKTSKLSSRVYMRLALILVLVAVTGYLNEANAQSGNMSDWAVPPPLAPGNITKGNTTGKSATSKPIVLTLSDIPATSLPDESPVDLPFLAAVSTTPPLVNIPDQPSITGVGESLPDIPLPGAPEAPSLSEQSSQDAPIQQSGDMPIPTEPEMPEPPSEPMPSKQGTTVKGPVPVTPYVVDMSMSSLPFGGMVTAWSTPGIPENISFKLIKPGEAKAVRPRTKGAKRARSPSPPD